MVADFVSPDYGWLRSPDGTEQTRVLFKPGKAREGYFTNADILEQAGNAMDILKRADDAISARHMPKYPPKRGNKWDGTDWGAGKETKNWGVEVNMVGDNGKPVAVLLLSRWSRTCRCVQGHACYLGGTRV